MAFTSLADGSHAFEVRSIDAGGNTDPTPASRSFSIDSVAPPPPRITATNPASPANDNNPRVKGRAQAGSRVAVYDSAGCGGSPLAAGGVGRFHSAGLAVSVPDNSKTRLQATATDAAGNRSRCSAAREYVEDSKAPPAPSIKATTPNSPANDNRPLVRGFALAPRDRQALCDFGLLGFSRRPRRRDALPCTGPARHRSRQHDRHLPRHRNRSGREHLAVLGAVALRGGLDAPADLDRRRPAEEDLDCEADLPLRR
jgi:hypothetical protein